MDLARGNDIYWSEAIMSERRGEEWWGIQERRRLERDGNKVGMYEAEERNGIKTMRMMGKAWLWVDNYNWESSWSPLIFQNKKLCVISLRAYLFQPSLEGQSSVKTGVRYVRGQNRVWTTEVSFCGVGHSSLWKDTLVDRQTEKGMQRNRQWKSESEIEIRK